MRDVRVFCLSGLSSQFPFLFGGAFIEGLWDPRKQIGDSNFPSFSEGLSLRGLLATRGGCVGFCGFPFLFGGAFIEGGTATPTDPTSTLFPFLFGGAFIEGCFDELGINGANYFPSFSEGLSLRAETTSNAPSESTRISLPFRRGFH